MCQKPDFHLVTFAVPSAAMPTPIAFAAKRRTIWQAPCRGGAALDGDGTEVRSSGPSGQKNSSALGHERGIQAQADL